MHQLLDGTFSNWRPPLITCTETNLPIDGASTSSGKTAFGVPYSSPCICVGGTVMNHWERRDFLKGLGALAGAASLSGYMTSAAAEPPPEVTTIKVHENSLSCLASQVIAGELMHAEGFTEVQYVNYPRDIQHWPPEDLLAGEVDITYSFPPTDVKFIDAGAPVAVLAAAHTGCV